MRSCREQTTAGAAILNHGGEVTAAAVHGRYRQVSSGLSLKWCLGVAVESASSGKDAQRRRSLNCVKAEDAASGVEGRRDTASISATDHLDPCDRALTDSDHPAHSPRSRGIGAQIVVTRSSICCG